MTQAILHILSGFGYEFADGTFTTRRPDQGTLPLVDSCGAAVVAKIYAKRKAETVYQNMLNLWNSSFGKFRNPPGLPRPVEFFADDNVLIMERLSGQPLSELNTTEHWLTQTIELLAALHQCGVSSPVNRGCKKIIRSLERKASNIEQIAPEFYNAYRKVVDALARVRPEDAPLVSSHGDFSPRNVLVCGDRVVFIDWDRFQQADPARDVAYFGLWCWSWALRCGQKPSWDVLNASADLYDAFRPEAAVKDRLSFHVAVGLLRVAHSLIKFWRDEIHVTHDLITEAQAQLERGSRK